MKHWFKRVSALLLGVLLATALAGCGAAGDESAVQESTETAKTEDTKTAETSETEDADTTPSAEEADQDIPTDTFSYIISVNIDSQFYTDYAESPAYQYWVSKPFEVDGQKRYLNLDFWAAPSGSESDYLNNLIATGEYADVFTTAYSSMKPIELYEEGIAIDITEYVEKYMPNYMAWVEEHDYYDYVTNLVDGERRFIQLYDVCDEPGEMWGGYMYRRDWIVKYGKNPKTQEAFTGSWQDDEKKIWVDDVVFPSGNTDPIYISDWEWMLDIFQTALEEQGIDDGYAFSIPYYGAVLTGDFITGFGGGAMNYINADGECVFGMAEDHTKAYIECMNTWWNNGWLDPAFDEHTNDMFFSIDQTKLYSGKVGAFYGLTSQLEGRMDTGSGDATDGAVIFGAPQPINDVYGTADDQGKEPTNYYGGSLVATSVVVTNKTEGKNLATFFTALDELYTPDGGMLRNIGLSKEQQAEFQSDFYLEWGLEDGAYEKVENTDGSYTYVLNPKRDAEDGLSGACSMMRVLAMTTNGNVDHGYTETEAHSLQNWIKYPTTGNIPTLVTAQLDADQTAFASTMTANLTSYVAQELPQFIRGEKTIEKDWEDFVEGMKIYGTDTYCGYINEILGK